MSLVGKALTGVLLLAGAINLFFILSAHSRVQNDRSLDLPPLRKSAETATEDPSAAKGQSLIEKTEAPQQTEPPDISSKVAGLSCKEYGGPNDEVAAQMVYWQDIPSDSKSKSPFKSYGPEHKFLTFEVDEGGWNNIRMAMETAVALAHAMGRTLVLPPEQGIYLLQSRKNAQKKRFGFHDFFPFDSIDTEHSQNTLTTQQFLEQFVLTGKVRNKNGVIAFPPNNRTDWDSESKMLRTRTIETFLRDFAHIAKWKWSDCVPIIPEQPGNATYSNLYEMLDQIKNETSNVMKRINSFHNNPTPVDAPTKDRLREHLSTRSDLCIYDQQLQEAQVVHFLGDLDTGYRLLVHFYVYLFFESYHQDLWTKRFVRDHLRYVDEIQCAAARVVDKVRTIARGNGNANGAFDTAHIRRGDFQYKVTRLSASEIYNRVHDVIHENATLYVATDERNKSFFDPLGEHYKLYFLDDFAEEIKDINTNYFGMLDQLIAAKGQTFVGTGFSTFTGYINRIRGHYSQKHKLNGYRNGTLSSYYFAPEPSKHSMSNYNALNGPFWGREWPVGWRDIDRDIS